MHNSVPQLGYFDKGLGVFIHYDNPAQMGDIFSDISSSLTKGVANIETNLSNDAKNLTTQGQNAVASALLSSPTGQQVQAQGIAAAVQARTAQLTALLTQYQTEIAIAVVLGLGAYIFFSKPKRSTSVTAATNPKRKRSRVKRKKKK